MKAVEHLSSEVGVAPACRALGVARASFYRRQRGSTAEPASRCRPQRALNGDQRQHVLNLLRSDRFVDKAPAEVYATLLDEGTYLCSIRTMYRILSEADEVRERRNQLRHPNYKKPELLATGPNQVWSWDITKLLGPAKWTYFYLFVILDIFSRYVVGWMLAASESSQLAQRLIRETIEKQEVFQDQLVIHSDRGPSMKSHGVAQLLATLGVTKSHSRPHVSNDNPFSESQFKTMKYRPEFPDRFGSQEHALAFCREFFLWYNDEHYHSGISMLTPAMVHHGLAEKILLQRQKALDTAYLAHPERFVKGRPSPLQLPKEVWINPPPNNNTPQAATQQANPSLIETDPAIKPSIPESELEISLLTSANGTGRLITPTNFDVCLNKMVTQINMNREEAPVLLALPTIAATDKALH